MKRVLLTTATLAMGLALTVPVFAQGGPAGGPGNGPGPAGGDRAGRQFSRMCEDREAHLAGMLAFAEKKLAITDQQRPAWTKFADAARASQKPMQDICVRFKDQPVPATAPQRLERMETMMQVRLQQLQQVRPALTDLYAQLTPDQQKTADRFLNHAGPMGGAGMGDSGMGHHGMGHHGMGGHWMGQRGPAGGPAAPAPQAPAQQPG